MAIAISRALHDALLAEAAADPGREVCGLLFGTSDRIDAVRPCLNVSPSPKDSFEIDPAALIAAHKAERAGGPRIVGCYHSHPNGRAEPSTRDAAAMDATTPFWLILACGKLKMWSKTDGSYAEVTPTVD